MASGALTATSNEGERVSTEYSRAPPPADYEPTSHVLESALQDESPDLQPAGDGATRDPEAQGNFLFVLPIAMFVMFAILGLVMCFDH